jgi:hypothetical protein
MTLTKIKRHDTAPVFTATLTDSAGAVVDLTGATAVFHMRDESDSSLKIDSGAMTGPGGGALDATGVVEYPWVVGDTDRAGLFFAEVEVTYPSSRVQTFPVTGYDKVHIFGDLDDA